MDPYARYLERPNRRRYARFVVAYMGPVSRLARRLVLSPDLADDVVQDVFVRLGTVKERTEDLSNPRAYVLRTTLNVAREQRKREEARGRHEVEAIELRPHQAPAASQEVMDAESVRALYQAMDLLPEALRVSIHLRAVEGLSYREIAEVTGASVSAVGMRIQRARKELKRLLGEAGFAISVLDLASLRDLVQSSTAPDRLAGDVFRRLLGEVPRSRRSTKASAASTVVVGAAVLGLVLLLPSSGEQPAVSDGLAVRVQDAVFAPAAAPTGAESDDRARAAPQQRESDAAPEEGAVSTPPSAPQTAAVNEQKPPSPSPHGDETMDRSLLAASLGLSLAVSASTAVSAQNLGDINGDGRVSVGDAFLLRQWQVTGLELFRPAAGSTEFGEFFPCAADREAQLAGLAGWSGWQMLVFHEALRRAVADPLPHFVEPWPVRAEPAPPLARDDVVRLEILPAVHDTTDNRVQLTVRMMTTVPVDFVALLVDSRDLDLRPPHPTTFSHSVSEQPVTSTEYYLLTRGLLAYHSDTPLDISTEVPPKTKDPGEHLLLLEAEIPRGTTPGDYDIQLLEATDVVTSFGTIVHPTLAPGRLTITKTVEQGHGLPFPPLRFGAGRQVAGSCKVRITGATGLPGDQVTVKLQMLTERPVNFLDTYILFDPRALRVDEIRNTYKDPETGSPVDLDSEVLVINRSRGYIDTRGGRLRYGYLPFPWKDDETLPPGARSITHVGYSPYRNESNGRSASLEYLRPLGEWIDVAEIRLTLLPEAHGRGILSMSFPETQTPLRPQDCAFLPYADRHMSGSTCSDFPILWTHAPVEWIAGEIEVLGGGDPPPPAEPPVDVDVANIRYALGERVSEDAVPKELRANPGDEVWIPWFLETDVPLWYIRLIIGFDNTALELQGFEVNFIDFDGVPYTERLPPPPGYCAAENTFGQGRDRFAGLFPYLAFLRDERDHVPEDRAFVDVYTVWNSSLEAQRFWEPGISYDVGSLLFRVREGASSGRYPIAREFAHWRPDECTAPSPEFIDSESGAVPPYDKSNPPDVFLVPAKEVTPALIVVSGEGGDGAFVRGDANDDGQVNVSDPVQTLGALFAGNAELPCEDAADANDDGEVNLADAVLVLNHLFASVLDIPEPYPEAGADPTEDELGCERIE